MKRTCPVVLCAPSSPSWLPRARPWPRPHRPTRVSWPPRPTTAPRSRRSASSPRGWTRRSTSSPPTAASRPAPRAGSSTARVFAPWLDPAQYFLAPDGGYEAGAEGWDLDGASVVDGNEPFEVSGPGTRSLALASGAAATSPVVCVGIDRPTIRFFAKRTGGSLLSSLRVDVNFVGPLGLPLTLPVGVVTGSSSWQPSSVMVVAASLLPLLPGERTPVTFTFTPQDGAWLVDDVHVDPYGKR